MGDQRVGDRSILNDITSLIALAGILALAHYSRVKKDDSHRRFVLCEESHLSRKDNTKIRFVCACHSFWIIRKQDFWQSHAIHSAKRTCLSHRRKIQIIWYNHASRIVVILGVVVTHKIETRQEARQSGRRSNRGQTET